MNATEREAFDRTVRIANSIKPSPTVQALIDYERRAATEAQRAKAPRRRLIRFKPWVILAIFFAGYIIGLFIPKLF